MTLYPLPNNCLITFCAMKPEAPDTKTVVADFETDITDSNDR